MVNSSYNWNAQDYAKNSANQFQWAKELIPKLKLNGNESLLDIGCGEAKSQQNWQNAYQAAEQSALTVQEK